MKRQKIKVHLSEEGVSTFRALEEAKVPLPTPLKEKEARIMNVGLVCCFVLLIFHACSKMTSHDVTICCFSAPLSFFLRFVPY